MKKIAFLGLVALVLCAAGVGLAWGGQARPLDSATQYLPMVFRGFVAGPGDLHGQVFDASKKDEEGLWIPVLGAEVCLEGVSPCVMTDMDGNYSFTNLPAGYYPMTVEHNDYYVRNVDAYVLDLKNTALDVPMVGKLELGGNISMRIVLSWADTDHWYGSDCGSGYPLGCPSDMDTHLWLFFNPPSLISYEHYHQYQEGDCASGAATCLEAVSWNGPGPETVAIVKTEDIDTMYYYGVHHYYGPSPRVPDIYHTGATVEIYTAEDYNKISVSEATGSGNFWYVFSMTAQGEITYQNCIIQKPQDPRDSNPTPPPTPLPAELPTCPTQ